MLTKSATIVAAAALIGAGVLAGLPLRAEAATSGFTGESASSVAGCPFIIWRLARSGDAVHGIAYYSDMSGLSQVSGTINGAGQFHLALTSTQGHGPVGTVTGTKSANGALTARMTGEGCANMTLNMRPVSDLNNFATGAGGAGGGGGHGGR